MPVRLTTSRRLPSLASALLTLAGCAEALPSPPAEDPSRALRDAGRELDDLHAAAAAPDEARYFGHFAEGAVFLGTDASERWDLAAFRAYAHPHFASGKGWTYVPVRRTFGATRSADVLAFEEDLRNEKLGAARGTGVLVHERGRWLVAQYSLSVPIPNAQMGAVVELVEAATRPVPPPSIDAIYRKAYETATFDAAFDPLGQAAAALLGALPEAKRHPEADTEFWLHNELTWVRWQQGDLKGALAEVDAAHVTLEHGTLSESKVTSLRLHELWDRAYLLAETAAKTPTSREPSPGARQARLAASAAKAAYDTLAIANHDSDGMAVLEAFFLVLAGKGKEASAAAHRVDVQKDEDLQDLYVIERAFEANGEAAAGAEVVARICAGHTYLMKPLILAQLAREGHACPARPGHGSGATPAE